MKTLKHLILLLLVSLSWFSCTKEKAILVNSGTVQFSFVPDTTYLPDSITSLVVTITNQSGSKVCENSVIALQKVNGTFQTNPLPLATGTYTITKYMVVNASGNVLEVVPTSSSSKKALVDVPLPIQFDVKSQTNTFVSPQVILAFGLLAPEVGYTSFEFDNQSQFEFLISIFIFDETDNTFKSTEALLSLKSDSVSITDTLFAGNNSIVTKDVSGRYVLHVSKDGYQDYVDTLDQSELLYYYKNAYAILLSKPGEGSISLVTDQTSLKKVVMWLESGNLNSLYVSWGDGKLETNSYKGRFSHEYTQPGIYRIFISGKIDLLTSLTASSGQLKSVNLDMAVNLASVDLSRNPIRSLDFSYLTHLKEIRCVEDTLETINLTGTDSLEVFYCSDNELKSIDVSTKPLLNTLYCDRNLLTSLDITHNPLLDALSFSYNSISKIDVSKNVALTHMEAAYNTLGDIDISTNNELIYIELTHNKFSSDVMNKTLVSILASVKINNRVGSAFFGLVSYGDGEKAQNELVNTYFWEIQ